MTVGDRMRHRRRTYFGWLGCALLIITRVAAPAAVPDVATGLSAQQLETIRQLGAAALDRDDLPGLSIAVGSIEGVWSFGFGQADLENAVPVTSASLFRTASISKWLTATATLRLVEDGKLNLDAPVQAYCPQYPAKQWTVTSRQLLSHLGGIRHYHGQNGESPQTDAERQALRHLIAAEQATRLTRYTDVIAPLDNFKNDALVAKPGTRVLYTSHGYVVLACVLEGATRATYRDLLRDAILRPAGMRSTRDDDAIAIIPHRVDGYSRDSTGALIRASFRDVSANLPAGGHLSTAEDLVRFALAFNAGALVSPATRDRMMERPKLSDGADAPNLPPLFGLGSDAYYGMGMFVGSLDGRKVVMHPGSQSGTSTELLLAPEHGVAVAVMANMNGWSGAHALVAAILQVAAE